MWGVWLPQGQSLVRLTGSPDGPCAPPEPGSPLAPLGPGGPRRPGGPGRPDSPGGPTLEIPPSQAQKPESPREKKKQQTTLNKVGHLSKKRKDLSEVICDLDMSMERIRRPAENRLKGTRFPLCQSTFMLGIWISFI